MTGEKNRVQSVQIILFDLLSTPAGFLRSTKIIA